MIVKPNTSDESPKRRKQEAADIQGQHRFRRHVRQKARRHNDTQEPDGNIHPEYPAPVKISGDEPADGRPHQGADEGWNGKPGQGIHQLRFWNLAQDDKAPHRHHHGAAQPLQGARRNEPAQRLGIATGDGAQHEHRNGGAKNMLCAETVGAPAADRNENREAQEIGGESQLQHDGVGAKVRRDGRQRRGNHRRIHVFHEQGGGYDERKQAGWRDHFDDNAE